MSLNDINFKISLVRRSFETHFSDMSASNHNLSRPGVHLTAVTQTGKYGMYMNKILHVTKLDKDELHLHVIDKVKKKKKKSRKKCAYSKDTANPNFD